MINRTLIEDVGRRSPALLFATDARGALEYVNERWTELLGVPGPALLAGDWKSFVYPDDFVALRRAFDTSSTSGEPYRGEFRMRHSDGVYRWIEVRAEPERDAGGAIVRWFGAGSDYRCTAARDGCAPSARGERRVGELSARRSGGARRRRPRGARRSCGYLVLRSGRTGWREPARRGCDARDSGVGRRRGDGLSDAADR